MRSLISRTHSTAPPLPVTAASFIFLHTLVLLAQYSAYPADHPPSCLIARVIHQSSPTPLRHDRTAFSPPLHRPPLQVPPYPSSSSSLQISPLPPQSTSSSSSATWTTAPALPSPQYASLPASRSSTSLASIEIPDHPKSGTYLNVAAAAIHGHANASEIGPLSSELITLHEPFGQYFAVMELGSPPSEIAVIIDTGSELTWVQCEPCLQCGSQIRDPIFDPSKSRSYLKILCNSTWCHDTTGLPVGCAKAATALSPDRSIYNTSSSVKPTGCFYNATYGDNSVSFGELSIDTLTVPSVSGAPVAVTRFVFGCGRENSGVETDFNASGLMGLDRGSRSIVSQLGVLKFAYCLPDRSHNIDAEGFIVFGNYDSISTLAQVAVAMKNASTPPSPMQYIRLLHNNKSGFYAQSYYVNLTGIRVGGQHLNIPSSVFDIDSISGYGGTIIDTGTSLTSLVDVAYVVFRDAVRSRVSGDARPIYIPELPSFDSCYTVGRGQDQAWPQVSLQFDGGTTELQLPEENVWLQVGTEGDRNLYCLAFAAAGEGAGGRNVIGNFQQQNLLVEYDVARARVGFVHFHRCSSGEGSRASSLSLLLATAFVSVAAFFVSYGSW